MLLKAAIIALGMYSKIPVPRVEWNEKNMRYALVFFPFVGAVTGAAVWAAARLFSLFCVPCDSIAFACVMPLISVFITGGIHLDGYLDTVDALSSYGDKNKRLAILKDPNCGAFAVIAAIAYFMLSIALWSRMKIELIPLVAAGYVMSRTLSGLSVTCFKKARQDGLAAEFGANTAKKISTVLFIVQFVLECLFLLYNKWDSGLAVIIASLLCFAYHYYNCKKNFGGITGDLAGYFLQLCELAVLAAVVIMKEVGL